MYLAHALLKVFTFTIPGTAQFSASVGLLGGFWFTYLMIAAELAAAMLLILGVGTRWVAALMLPILAGVAWIQWPHGWVHTSAGGGWEYPVFLAAASIALLLLGDGAMALRLQGP